MAHDRGVRRRVYVDETRPPSSSASTASPTRRSSTTPAAISCGAVNRPVVVGADRVSARERRAVLSRRAGPDLRLDDQRRPRRNPERGAVGRRGDACRWSPRRQTHHTPRRDACRRRSDQPRFRRDPSRTDRRLHRRVRSARGRAPTSAWRPAPPWRRRSPVAACRLGFASRRGDRWRPRSGDRGRRISPAQR